jgi:hypothetical protein
MARHPRITLAVETIGGFDDGELTITAAETYISSFALLTVNNKLIDRLIEDCGGYRR